MVFLIYFHDPESKYFYKSAILVLQMKDFQGNLEKFMDAQRSLCKKEINLVV